MDDEQVAAKARLAELQAKFADRLRVRVAELREAVDAAVAEPAGIVAALDLAHRLAGTAGSFGYASAGQIAGELEGQLQRARDADADWPGIHATLAALEATLS
jgi:HPt (histidine-containing phosphotransfer) domain-containing protein